MDIKKEKTVGLEIAKFKRTLEEELDKALQRKNRSKEEIMEITGSLRRQFADTGEQAELNHRLEINVGLCESSNLTVKKIKTAIGTLAKGTFGQCAECKEDISLKRLEAVPWQDTCLRCQKNKESQSQSGCLTSDLFDDDDNQPEKKRRRASV